MKKIFLALSFLIMAQAKSQFVDKNSASNPIHTVSSASKLEDDTPVILEGYILKEIRHEHYLFKDDTGEIEIEIDDDDFRGIQVSPKDKITIFGEVDVKVRKAKILKIIDVDSISKSN